MKDLEDRLTGLAREAGQIALTHYRKGGYQLKADGSVVTEADREVEEFLKRRLGELIPQAAYIGEETACESDGVEKARRSEWVWVVDPIDGTAAFTTGLDTFCVSVGLLRDNAPYAGCVVLPALKHSYLAVKGQGAFYDGEPVRVLSRMPVMDRASIYVSSEAYQELDFAFGGKVRAMGSTALHYVLVARGAAVGALSSGHVWDLAGAAAVVKEAGGEIRHLDGGRIDWPRWFTGENLHPAVLAAPSALWNRVAGDITCRA